MRRSWLLIFAVCGLLLILASAAIAAERFPPPDFSDHALPTITTPPSRPEVFEYRRSGGAGRRARPGFVAGHRKALAARAVRAWPGVVGVARIRPPGLHLPDRGDPERHAGPVRFALRDSLDGGRGVRPAAAVYALFRPNVLRRRLPVGGGARVGRRPSDQRAELARSGARRAGLRLSRGGRDLRRHRRGVRDLPLRPLRRFLPP